MKDNHMTDMPMTPNPSKKQIQEKGRANMKDKKPDKTKHEGKSAFKPPKKDCCPGQMYTPKKVHNESKFAGDNEENPGY